MKKNLAAVSCLALILVTGLNAGRKGCDMKAPVCRFMEFYVAAEKAEMTTLERVLYGLAVAVRTPESRCSASAVPDHGPRS